jgi:hypothetical protein
MYSNIRRKGLKNEIFGHADGMIRTMIYIVGI